MFNLDARTRQRVSMHAINKELHVPPSYRPMKDHIAVVVTSFVVTTLEAGADKNGFLIIVCNGL